jgi:hypothetical protein
VAGKPAVAILSYGIWQRLFHSDPNAIGRGVTLNTRPYTIAGVLRPEFRLNHEVMQTVSNTDRCDIFLPLPLGADAATRRGDENYNLTARLKPGVTLEQAQADIAVIAARIREKDKRDSPSAWFRWWTGGGKFAAHSAGLVRVGGAGAAGYDEISPRSSTIRRIIIATPVVS